MCDLSETQQGPFYVCIKSMFYQQTSVASAPLFYWRSMLRKFPEMWPVPSGQDQCDCQQRKVKILVQYFHTAKLGMILALIFVS